MHVGWHGWLGRTRHMRNMKRNACAACQRCSTAHIAYKHFKHTHTHIDIRGSGIVFCTTVGTNASPSRIRQRGATIDRSTATSRADAQPKRRSRFENKEPLRFVRQPTAARTLRTERSSTEPFVFAVRCSGFAANEIRVGGSADAIRSRRADLGVGWFRWSVWVSGWLWFHQLWIGIRTHCNAESVARRCRCR